VGVLRPAIFLSSKMPLGKRVQALAGIRD
jgi:hypothetical protein